MQAWKASYDDEASIVKRKAAEARTRYCVGERRIVAANDMLEGVVGR